MRDKVVTGIFVGRSTLDIVYACETLPEADGKIDAIHSYVCGGGPALNAAAAFAGLGGRARLCSALGDGVFAEAARQDLSGSGVQLFDAAQAERNVLPVSSVILTGSRRAIVNQPLPERSRPLDPALLDALFATRSDVVLSDGHLPELAVPVLRRAREAGAPTVLDGGSWKPWTPELLPLVDIAVVSSRFRPPGEDDALEALARIIGAVAITNGPHPIRWRSGQAHGEIRPPAIQAVDTLGAGDVFHGAFCHALASGADFASALAAAAQIAARSCETWGPRGSLALDLPALRDVRPTGREGG